MKTAVVLFADTPLLEQAGLNLKGVFSANIRLALYHSYVQDCIAYFAQQGIEFWLTCEEAFQETLLQQQFPQIKGCRVASGNMGKKLTLLTDYFLTFQGCKNVTFLFQPFTFVWPDLKAHIEQAFRRTSRSVLLLTSPDSLGLHALTVSFPFSRLYEDITWEKTNRYKQIKDHCEDSDIPCKRMKVACISLLPVTDTLSKDLSILLLQYYPNLYRTLTIAKEKKTN